MPTTTQSSFAETWARLSQLSDRIFRRGFDGERILISASHEIRGLASHWLEGEGRYLVVAGDKSGCWHAAMLDPKDPEMASPRFLTFEPPRPPEDGYHRVIDEILIVPTGPGGELSIVLATRGNGIWITHFESVKRQVESLGSKRGRGEVVLEQLETTAGRRVHRLVHDPAARALLALAGHDDKHELFCWSLETDPPVPVDHQCFDYPLTCLAIDQDRREDKEGDLLFVATGRFELFSFQRPSPGGAFQVSARGIEEKRDRQELVWRGRLSPILRLRPLSDVGIWVSHGQGRVWQRAFEQRGVFAMTLRHLVLIEGQPGEKAYSHARLVVGETKNLDLAVLNLPCRDQEQEAMGLEHWHGVAVSTLEGKMRIFRPSGMRRPGGGEFDHFDRRAPEADYPMVLLSGYSDLQGEVLPDRVYAMQTLVDPGCGKEVLFLFGLGNNEVRWHRFQLTWRLRREAREIARQMVECATSVDGLLETLQEIALSSLFWQDENKVELVQDFHPRRDKHTLLEILPRLWRTFEHDDHWHDFYLLVWDILARRTPRYVAVGMVQALRRVQVKLPDELSGAALRKRHGELEQHVNKIRKFVLDPGNFSKKRTRFLELLNARDPDLADERVIYRSILLARRHDPVFLRDFDPADAPPLGEVLTFLPLPSAAGPFWQTREPGEIRFVTSNYYGALWLLDGVGRARQLIDPRPEGLETLGYVRATHLHGEKLLLAFSSGQIRCLDWRRLPPTAELPETGPKKPLGPPLDLFDGVDATKVDATVFLSVPRAGGEPELLWGDTGGHIHGLGVEHPLYVPKGVGATSPRAGSRAIVQLAWLEAEWPGGAKTPFVLAATGAGRLLLFRWKGGDFEGAELLEECAEAQVGNDSISALLVTGPQSRHIAVARYDTAVGLKLLGAPEAPRLGLAWAFRTGDTVRSIQAVPPGIARDGGPPRILVGSHDAHFHALDLEGRHLETYSLRQDPLHLESKEDDGGFKVGLFAVAPPYEKEDSDEVLLRVYACAFENRYIGLRLIDRPQMLRKFDREELESFGAQEQELRLTRWRAYHVDEGHLRHRFIRQSRRYPSIDPKDTMGAMEWLLEAGNTGYEPTGEFTALLRRLFQTRPPIGGENFESGELRGLQALFQKPELYRDAVALLKECEKRWDTPNSLANQRLLLFWIRSMLREIDDPATLRRWLEVGEQAASGPEPEPMARPVTLIRRFLEQSNRFIQYKTLQYLERMVFGWPGSRRPEPLFHWKDLQPGDLDWLLEVLFARLALRPEQVSLREPSPVVFQIGRLLCLMMREGYVDPLYLTYLVQLHSIDHDAMYGILGSQWEAFGEVVPTPGTEGVIDPLEVLRQARLLDQSLAQNAPLNEVAKHLEVLIDRPWPPRSGPDAKYLEQAPVYFGALLPLLRVTDLEGLWNLVADWRWQPPHGAQSFEYCPSYEILGGLRPLLDAVHDYYLKKYDDMFGDAQGNKPMTLLRFEDFDRVQQAWQTWRQQVKDLLMENPLPLAHREKMLLKRLLSSWKRILVTQEKKQDLIRDFQQAVDHSFQRIEQSFRFDPEAVRRVLEEKAQAYIAFDNLFTRLLLLVEPVRGVFLYRWSEEGQGASIRGRWFERRGDSRGPQDFEDAPLPDWLPAEWLDPEVFAALDEGKILRSLGADSGESGSVCEIEAVSGTPDEECELAYYIFTWEDSGHSGLERFKAQRHAWTLPLQALVYRRATMEQVELKGKVFSIIAHNLGAPVFHLRSDLRMLLDRRLEGAAKQEKRFEKYTQLLRQARHMDGIIDGVLSLSDREIEIQISKVSIARLTYEVVRTVRRDASARKIQIEFPEPTDEGEEATVLWTDEPKVYDILLNLLDNAIKYSPVAAHVVVEVQAKHLGQRLGVEVRIRDQGPGIPVTEKEQVYDAFFRGTTARDTAGGLGLGLYVVRLYTDLLEGRISQQNQAEGGSLFTLYLPDLEQKKPKASTQS